jgi:hypothetical protein
MPVGGEKQSTRASEPPNKNKKLRGTMFRKSELPGVAKIFSFLSRPGNISFNRDS